MKAVLFRSNNEPLQITEIDRPVPQAGELLISLKYAALNHLDLWIWREQILENPVILGSDGSGVVCEVGPNADSQWIGKEVIINPSLNWGDDENRYLDTYQILGNPTNGTFAHYISISQQYVHEKPVHLTLKEAAALPMACLTAYRAAITKAKLSAGDKVLITGIGGGVALYLLQMAVAMGAEVFVTSSSDEKLQKAVELGAKGGYNYKQANWVEQAKKDNRGFDVIFDSSGGDGFVSLCIVANQAARIILFGRTAGNINNLDPSLIYNKQLQISGTVMGTAQEFEAMLAFYQKHQLHPVIDKEFPLSEIAEAFRYMNEGAHFGKVVFKVN